VCVQIDHNRKIIYVENNLQIIIILDNSLKFKYSFYILCIRLRIIVNKDNIEVFLT